MSTMSWRIHRDGSAVRLELGRLWLIRCAPGHPNRWAIVWRRDDEYAREARETADRETAANPEQAARLRKIDELLARRGIQP
jgi:hypothetical protein